MSCLGLLLRSVAGPLGPPGIGNKVAAVGLTLVATVVTQVGGLVLWPVWGPVFFVTRERPAVVKWPARGLALFGVYLLGTQVLLPPIARQTGRVRLPWVASESLPLGPGSAIFPLLNRNYVRPHVREALVQSALETGKAHPGSVVRYLDAGFPFPWPPLLPHISHGDGQKVDLAFLYRDGEDPVDRSRSPIGYFGYALESEERPECEGAGRQVAGVSVPLRWNMPWLQPLLPPLALDTARSRTLLNALARRPTVCSLLLEPTLHPVLPSRKLHANGCSVARHDDHVHVTVRQSCAAR